MAGRAPEPLGSSYELSQQASFTAEGLGVALGDPKEERCVRSPEIDHSRSSDEDPRAVLGIPSALELEADVGLVDEQFRDVHAREVQ